MLKAFYSTSFLCYSVVEFQQESNRSDISAYPSNSATGVWLISEVIYAFHIILSLIKTLKGWNFRILELWWAPPTFKIADQACIFHYSQWKVNYFLQQPIQFQSNDKLFKRSKLLGKQATILNKSKLLPQRYLFPFVGLPPPTFLMLYKTVQEFTQSMGTG